MEKMINERKEMKVFTTRSILISSNSHELITRRTSAKVVLSKHPQLVLCVL